MKLNIWAKKQDVSYRTTWRWFKEGNLPVPAEQTPSGTVLIKEIVDLSQAAIYVSVFSIDF